MSARYYCGSQALQSGIEVCLPAEESRHLVKVMRARTGDRVVVFGEHGQFTATLTGTGEGGAAKLLVGEMLPGTPPPSVQMTFVIPWIKGGKTELLVQKLTELGASRLIVFQARHEVARGDESKIDRLSRTALEACKQCERIEIPSVEFASSLANAVSACPDIPVSCRFVLHERQTDNLFTKILSPALKQSTGVLVASGPEGGWHPDETKSVSGQVTVASLGPRILRAETAPIAAAAAILALAGDL